MDAAILPDLADRHPGDARALTLRTTPATPKAAALVASLVARVDAWEALQGARRYRRGDAAREALGRAVAALAGGVVLNAARVDDPAAWSWQGLGTVAFTGEPVAKRAFEAARAALIGDGLVQERPAFTRFHNFGGGIAGTERHASRFAAAPLLWTLAKAQGITPTNAAAHFTRPLPSQDPPPLRLRELSQRGAGGRRVPGATLPVPDTAEARALADGVARMNRWWRGMRVEGADPPIFFRGFTRSLAFGGRWWAEGGGFQQMKATDRLALLRLDGEAVVEVDARASHLAILHGLAGATLPGGDPYALPDGPPREVVKAWVAQTIGNGAPPARWSREVAVELGDALRGWTVVAVGGAVMARYPFLTNLPAILGCPDEPRLASLRLQRIEADALTFALDAMREAGRPALPMHDALIARERDAAAAEAAMCEGYRRAAGVVPEFRAKGSRMPS